MVLAREMQDPVDQKTSELLVLRDTERGGVPGKHLRADQHVAKHPLPAPGTDKAETVIVLPDNGNILLTARQAAGMYDKSRIEVIPTHSPAEGYFALANLDVSLPADEIRTALVEALRDTVTGSVSRAIRDCEAGVAGDFLGIGEKAILCGSPDRTEALLEMARKLDAGSHDIALLFQGESVSAEEAATAQDALTREFPRTEITLIEGGQPIYDYILLLC